MKEATYCHLLRGNGLSTRVALGIRESQFWNGIWCGTGGKLEKGEDAYACVKREVREEFNVIVDGRSPVHFATADYHYNDTLEWRVHFFNIRVWKGKIQPADGFSTVKWFDLHDLPYQLMYPDLPIWLPRTFEEKSDICQVKIFYNNIRESKIRKSLFEFVKRKDALLRP